MRDFMQETFDLMAKDQENIDSFWNSDIKNIKKEKRSDEQIVKDYMEDLSFLNSLIIYIKGVYDKNHVRDWFEFVNMIGHKGDRKEFNYIYDLFDSVINVSKRVNIPITISSLKGLENYKEIMIKIERAKHISLSSII